MTKDFENFLAANLAALRVFGLRRSADLFQTQERRFAAKFLQPGTGSIALEHTELMKSVKPKHFFMFCQIHFMSYIRFNF